jgi:lysozyme family protein
MLGTALGFLFGVLLGIVLGAVFLVRQLMRDVLPPELGGRCEPPPLETEPDPEPTQGRPVEPPVACLEPHMRERYGQCLAEVVGIEGGYSNRKRSEDPGGPTMRGVTQRVYDGYRDSRGLPKHDVRLITDPEVADLYKRFYWDLVHGDVLPAGLDLAAFDFAIHSGPVIAIRKLQVALGCERVDGHCGGATLGAIEVASRTRRVPDLIAKFMAERRSFGRTRDNYWANPGWEPRWNRIENSALHACGEYEWAAEIELAPLTPDPEERSAEQGRATADDPRPPATTELALGGTGGTSLTYAAPGIFGRSLVGGRFSFSAFAIALLTEPLFWVGVIMVWGAVKVYFWRKAHAR